ncbi:MAG: hypothetical protein U1E47_09580 [Rivihabitans pingtungensis]
MVAVLAAVFHQPLPWFITTQGFPHIVKQRGWHIGVPHNIVIDPQQLFATEAGHVHKRIIGVGDDPLQIGFGDNRPVRERFFTPGDGLIQLHPLATPDIVRAACLVRRLGVARIHFFAAIRVRRRARQAGATTLLLDMAFSLPPPEAGALKSPCNISHAAHRTRQAQGRPLRMATHNRLH